MFYKIKIYVSSNSKEPFIEWLEKENDKTTIARIQARIDRIMFGNLGDYKSLGDGLYELRLHFSKGYRIYFGKKKR